VSGEVEPPTSHDERLRRNRTHPGTECPLGRLRAVSGLATSRRSLAGGNDTLLVAHERARGWALRRHAGGSDETELASAMDEQQLYGGTQSALSTTLLLWKTSSLSPGEPAVPRTHPAHFDPSWP
jgi:hypothetical protein